MAESTASRAEATHSERLRDHARSMQESAGELGTATRGAADELSALAREQLETRPYVTLGCFAAAGFLLGGGLTPSVLRRLIGIGGRVAVSTAVRQLIERD